jgi:hypothetical protein
MLLEGIYKYSVKVDGMSTDFSIGITIKRYIWDFFIEPFDPDHLFTYEIPKDTIVEIFGDLDKYRGITLDIDGTTLRMELDDDSDSVWNIYGRGDKETMVAFNKFIYGYFGNVEVYGKGE